MRPYRLVTSDDMPDLQTPELLAQFVLDTAPYDGVRLDVELVCGEPAPDDEDPPTPGYKLDVLYLDRSTGKLTEDKSQAITVNEAGSQTFKVETAGRSVYIRVSTLTGVTPVLTILYGAYFDTRA